MKKIKTIKQFYFTKSNNEILQLLDTRIPISLKYNEELISRIYQKYPLLSKTEISYIVNAVFKSLRQLLVLGNVLNFNSLFFDVKLHFFSHRRAGVIYPSLKVKISTPPNLRKINHEI